MLASENTASHPEAKSSEIVSKKSRKMLSYENEMFLDIVNVDGLVIAAKGLGLEDVFLSLLKVYSDPGNLVIVLGTTAHEENYYVDRLTADKVTPLPKIISSESGTAKDRISLYLEGGVMFVPPRILVVDLLKDRLPTAHVTGILVYRAHTVLNSCQEAFAVRLYRQKNKTGFVKAFSSSPLAFTAGFSLVSRVMKILFVKQLLLWPRFQATVQACLGYCSPKVVEMHVKLTQEMTTIQNAILDLMNLTVREIKNVNPTLDIEHLTVENAIAKSFHKILQTQLDPIWHQLSAKTKSLIADLKLLRVFLHYLTRYDCVTFNSFISSYRNREYVMSSSGWMLLDAANTMFEAAKRRVVGTARDDRPASSMVVRKAGKADKKAVAAKKRKTLNESRKKQRKKCLNSELHVESPVKFTQLSQKETEEVEEKEEKEESEEDVDDVEEVKEEDNKEKGKDTSGEPEPSPKWLVVRQVLKEIKEVSQESPVEEGLPDRVLILVEDKLTAKQLQDYLLLGSRETLRRSREKQLSSRPYERRAVPDNNARSPPKPGARWGEAAERREMPLSSQMLLSQRDVEEAGVDGAKSGVEKKKDEEQTEMVEEEVVEEAAPKEVYILSQSVVEGTKEAEAGYQVYAEKISELDLSMDTSMVVDAAKKEFHPPIVIIQTLKASGNPLSLPQTLDEARPRFILLYDVDVAAIRRIEVYQNALPDVKVNVYVIVFGGSVEEQAYLTSLRREKEAFEALIKEKTTMVVPEDQDGKSDTCTALARDSNKPSETVNSRRGDVVSRATRQTVLVDMREFNSELPAMIHRRGIDIEPLTLQVGDYILTPEICVERKSISDLIGSLNNGRLYNQAKAMTRYYSRPILLIESDQNKPLTLMGNYYISKDVSINDVQARLILLTLHFPQLRIFWSPSPHATAQLFEELKQFREEPDGFTAVGIGVDMDEDLEVNDKYNPGVYDLLSRLPGVTSKNIRSLVTNAKSLDHLASFSRENLVALMGNARQAECLYNAFHRPYNADEDVAGYKKQKVWKGRRFGGPKKR